MKIADAIRNRQMLTFQYHGHHRVVEPYTYGIDQKGHAALRAYQTGGTSGSGRIPDWRIFHESEILALKSLEQHFDIRSGDYKKNDSFFSTIYAEL